MKVAFKTLGCRLNQAEEAAFMAQFLALGWEIVTEKEEPDALVLHSCAVTRMAERETFRLLRAYRAARGEGERPIVVLTGCAAACNDEQALHEAGADLIVHKADVKRLAEIVAAALSLPFVPLEEEPLPNFHWHWQRALLKVQDGCDFRCAYCIVPYTRGPSGSVPFEKAIENARGFLEKGFREIVLTGCNLACYRDGAKGFPELADAVCTIAAEAGARVRFGSVEPGICDDAFPDLFRAHSNLCPFLHLPVQSGDTKILRAMGRPSTAESISALLEKLTAEFPLLAIGGDFITGLPGEDEESFLRTCELVRRFGFAHLHIFPYSPRQGTRALAFEDRPSRAVAKERAGRLRAIGRETASAYAKRWIGRPTTVLLEGRGEDGLAYGWNEGYVQCHLPAPGVPVAELATFTPRALAKGVLKS